jgi:tetratricopeptide (TPR) repeat protein
MPLGWIFVIVYSAAHAAAALAGGTWWGLHFFRYLDPPRVILVLAVACAAAVALSRSREPSGWLAPRAHPLVLGVAALVLFWILRDRLHFLGDGSMFLDLEAKWSTWASREPLAHVLAVRVRDGAGVLGIPAERAFELWSCILGAAFVAALAFEDRASGSGGLLFAFGLTTGATQLFCGYIEHYPPLAIVVVFLLFEMRRAVERPRTLALAFAWFAAALLLHVQAVLLLPALAWTAWKQLTLRSLRGRALVAVELAGVALATAAAWSVFFSGIEGAPSIGGYLSIFASTDRYALGSTHDASSVAPPFLSWRHARDVANAILLLVPVALPVAAGGLFKLVKTAPRGALARSWETALALAAASYLAAQLVFHPYLGPPRDWDVLAVGAFPIAFLAARLVPEILPRPRARGIAAGLAAAHTLAFVLVNATPSAARARFEELPLTAGQVDFVLGTRALKAGDFDEASARFEKVVQAVPYSTVGWFSLGLSRESRRDFERAYVAFVRALESREFDQRVPAADILERIGRTALETGRDEEARVALGRALAERPESVTARLALGMLAMRETRPDEALKYVEPLLAAGVDHPGAWVLAADALEALGRGDEARAHREKARRIAASR